MAANAAVRERRGEISGRVFLFIGLGRSHSTLPIKTCPEGPIQFLGEGDFIATPFLHELFGDLLPRAWKLFLLGHDDLLGYTKDRHRLARRNARRGMGGVSVKRRAEHNTETPGKSRK